MANELNATLLQADPDANGPPRIAGMSETGFAGLRVFSKQVLAERDERWRMPSRIRTVDEMMTDGYVSAAIEFYIAMLSQVTWKVKAPIGASPKAVERAKFVETCRHDMSHSWDSFMRDALTAQKYGFAVIEKVYKYRRAKNSRHDDGLIGWAKLPLRDQSTTYGWEFSDDGRELTGYWQTLQNVQYSARYSNILGQGIPLEIPREKFLLFTVNSHCGNPEGNPPLKAAYYAWRMKREIENQELLGASRDLSGLFCIGMPATFMDANASADKKSVYEEYKKVLRNVARGEQQGIIIPSDVDPETKQKLFTAELMQSSGASSYDTNAIIQRYASQMLVSLFADLLQMGTNSTGSFALSDNKREVIEFALKARLNEIKDVLNFDLIPQLFKMNQWDLKELPTFEYGEINPIDLESLSKAVQRFSATSSIEIDRQVLNITRQAIGADPLPEADEPNQDYLPQKTSKSGQGMSQGLPGGTGDATGSSGNSSDMNSDNTA